MSQMRLHEEKLQNLVSLKQQRFTNVPNVLKLSVQVQVAHSTLRTVSMLVTCLLLDASPETVT